ncbi:MFS transporter [Pelomonas sp. KK5]|uniref:MFS transporter n=1 Tax=Pelomonas sp. KK5 TaxID=1855730 RepID=UPI001E4D773A|nr:MFS transporter [Pelomonas sp. KK5]
MTATTMASGAAAGRGVLWADRNFRLLLAGGTVSLLGDQFTLTALPWLVLQLTGDPLALGVVLALLAVPRAVFILIGGALVDRHSPRTVLVASKAVQGGLLALLALALQGGWLTLPLVNAFALLMGLATAFSHPAGSALLPRCLPPALVRPANGLLMSAGQLMMLLGPLLAGGMVAALHHGGAALPDAHGLALAFGVDGASFAFSAATVLALKGVLVPAQAGPARGGLLADVAEAARAFWADVPLRAVCLYFAAVACFAGGPVSVALPVLAQHLPGGSAASLGLLLAANGAGVLAGMALSGMRPDWRLGTLGRTMLAIDALAGLAFAALGLVHETWQAVALLAPLGLLLGFVRVAVFSWMQKRVPPAMLGRTMSLFLFIIMGLTPLATAAAGAALRVLSPAALFAAGGAALIVVVIAGAVLTPIRDVDDQAG